jgi:hypothetical protein
MLEGTKSVRIRASSLSVALRGLLRSGDGDGDSNPWSWCEGGSLTLTRTCLAPRININITSKSICKGGVENVGHTCHGRVDGEV